MRKRSLGRGLSQLLSTEAAPETRAVVEVPLDKIGPNPHQPRASWDEETLEELAQSIEAHGVLQPVIVRRRGENYQLVAGERRWRAARQVGLETIPCLIQDIDDRTALQMALVENLQREDLNEMELAEGYKCLVEDFGATQEELAQHVGKSRSAVTNTLRLLDLPAAVQELVREGRLSAGHGRALLGLGRSEAEIVRVAEWAVEKGLSVRDTELLVREVMDATSDGTIQPSVRVAPRSPAVRDPYIVEAEERLQSVLAAKVLIRPRARRGGVIHIHYFDDEDLSRLVDEIDAQGRFP